MGLGWMCETKAVNGWHHLPMIVGQAAFLPGLEMIMQHIKPLDFGRLWDVSHRNPFGYLMIFWVYLLFYPFL